MKENTLTYIDGNNILFPIEHLLKLGKINKLNAIEKEGDENLITLEAPGMVINFIIDQKSIRGGNYVK